MADEIVQSIIQLKLDNATVGDAQQGIESVKEDLASLTDSANEASNAAAALGKQLKDTGKQTGGGTAGGGLGGTRRFLGAAGGILNRVAPGAGTAFGLAGDITELSKDFPKLKEAIGGLSKGLIAGGLAAGGLAIALAVLNQRFQEGKKAAGEELDARQRALTLLREGTTEEIQNRVKELQQAKTAREADAASATKFLQDLRDGIKQNFGDAGLAVSEFNAKLGTGAPELAKAIENADAATKALGTTNTELDLLTQAAKNGAPTQADLAKAEQDAAAAAKKLTEQLYQFAQDSIDSQIETNKKLTELMQSGSEEQLNAAIKSTQDAITATKQKIDAEYALAKQYENEPEIYGQISEEITKLQKHQTDLQTSLDQLSNSTIRAYTVANDAARKQDEVQAAVVDAYEKYQADIKDITSKYNEDSAALEQKRIDKLEQIQQQAVDDAQKLLEGLQQKQADLAQNLNRELADETRQEQAKQLQDQITFARQEVQTEKKTQDDIARIKRQAQENEFELSLDRNFAGLARARRQTANQISDVTEQAGKDRQARLTAFRQQQQDEQTNFANERAQKIAKYQQDMQDAQATYQRERIQLIQNRNRQISEAQTGYNQESAQLRANLTKQLQLKYQAAQTEINLAKQTADVKNKIFEAEYQAAVRVFNLINGMTGGSTSGGGGGSVRGRAFGGSLSLGDIARVNEPQSSGRESFRTGGKSYTLPGAGVFIPSRAGNVEANGGSQTISINAPITVNGAGQSPEKVAELVDQKLETTIRKIFVNKAS